MAKEISHVCSVGMNAEFLARGFVAAVEYYRTLEPEVEKTKRSSATNDDEMGLAFSPEKAGEISRPEGNSRA